MGASWNTRPSSTTTGPTGLYVATGDEIPPLNSVEGISVVAQSAMLTSLGSTPEAKEYQAAMQHSFAAAHEVDAHAVV